MKKFRGVFAKFQDFSDFRDLWNYFPWKIHRICPHNPGLSPSSSAHGSTDFIKRWSLASGSMAWIKSSESVSLLGCLDPIERWVAIGSSQPMQESPGVDPMAEAAGTGRGRRRLTLTGAHRGRARRLAGVWVFSSYGGRFSMRFAHTESQRRWKHVYANLNWRRATMKLDNGEGGLRWSFGSKDVRQGFLVLPSSFLTDQLLWPATKNSNLVAT
jgi:hypothetical protein